MEKKTTISVCMIVKNEEKVLEECLESVKEIADEIVTVDNGSTDNTLNVLKKYNCKIIDGSKFYVDEARNLYLDSAKGEWILIIDADERLDKKSYNLVKETLRKAGEDVYGIQIKNIQYLGKGLWCEVPALRIIRNNKGIKYDNSPIHASLGTSITQKNKKIINTDIILHHIDILISERAENKRLKYRKSLEKMLAVQKVDKDERYYLNTGFYAMEYIAIGEYEKAEKILKDSLKKEDKFRAFLKVFLCQLYIFTGKFVELKKEIETATPDMDNLLKETDVSGNYYCYFDRKMCEKFYEEQCRRNPGKISNYLNLAYLIKDKDKIRAKELIDTAFEKNSYLSNPLIYKEGDKYNIFKQQSNFLFPIENLKLLI